MSLLTDVLSDIWNLITGDEDVEIKNRNKQAEAHAKKQAEEKAKKEAERLAKQAALGIGKGVSKGKASAQKQVEKVAVSLTSTLKEQFGLNGSNNAIRDEVGKMIPQGIAVGIESDSKKVVNSFNKMLSSLDYQRQMDIINDEQYYAALESLRDRYFTKGSDKWLYYTGQIYDYQKELLEQEKKRYKETYDEIYDYISDKVEAVIQKQENYANKLKSYGSIFQKNTIRLDEGDIEFFSLADLKSDGVQLERYAELMLEAKDFIKNSGLSEIAKDSLLSDISSLPAVSSISALEALLRSPLTSDWLADYENRIKLSQNHSKLYYSDEMDLAVDEGTKYMQQKLSEAGFEIPETFFDAGKDSAEKFGEGFALELEQELDKLKKQISEFSAGIEINVNQASSGGGNTYSGDTVNTANYYITGNIKEDAVAVIKRYETIKRLGGY